MGTRNAEESLPAYFALAMDEGDSCNSPESNDFVCPWRVTWEGIGWKTGGRGDSPSFGLVYRRVWFSARGPVKAGGWLLHESGCKDAKR